MKLTLGLLSFILVTTEAVNSPVYDAFCSHTVYTEEEQTLYTLISLYRQEHGLPWISLSKVLTCVAGNHCEDQVYSAGLPDGNPCGENALHSWTGCCFSENPKCSWDVPRKFSDGEYTAEGYEISYGSLDLAMPAMTTALGALESWKMSSDHSDVILNEGMWSDKEWKAIGIGIYGGFANVWFATELDET